MMHWRFRKAVTRSVQFMNELDAYAAAVGNKFDSFQRVPTDQSEITVHVAHRQVK